MTDRVTFALEKASGLRRGLQISPMLPIFASVSVSLTPLLSPHSLSPAIAPSLPPERPSPSCRPSAYVGLRHARGFREALSHSLPDYRHTSCIHSLIGRFYTNEYSCSMTSLLSYW